VLQIEFKPEQFKKMEINQVSLPSIARIRVTQTPELIYSYPGSKQNQRSKIEWSSFKNGQLGSKQELLLNLNNQNIYLSGNEGSDFEVEGNLRLEQEAIGNFTIKALNVEKDSSKKDLSNLFLSLYEENYEIENQLPVITTQLSKAQEELAEFELILNNKEQGFAKVQEQFEEEKNQVEKLKREYEELLTSRTALDQQKDLNLKLDPYGRLVDLSRESLSRENAIIKQSWEQSQQNVISSPEQLIARVEQVEQQLELERLKIRELREMQVRYEN
jgi:hypothetical protein